MICLQRACDFDVVRVVASMWLRRPLTNVLVSVWPPYRPPKMLVAADCPDFLFYYEEMYAGFLPNNAVSQGPKLQLRHQLRRRCH